MYGREKKVEMVWGVSFIDGFTVYFWAEHIVELRPGRDKGIGLRTWVELLLLAERMCTSSEKKREFLKIEILFRSGKQTKSCSI